MSVDNILQKLVDHNSVVLGCIATHGDKLHENLADQYELIDAGAVAERVGLMFAASDALETEHDGFDQVFMEYEAHGLYARRLDEGVLVLVTTPMQRAQFKKAQVGVNLFMKPLKKALAELPEPADETTKEDAEAPQDKSVLGRIYRGVRY